MVTRSRWLVLSVPTWIVIAGPGLVGQAGTAEVSGKAKSSVPSDVQIRASDSERASQAAFFYRRADRKIETLGQFELNYGQPLWRTQYAKLVETAEPGTRLRLGKDFFSTFDTSCALDVGGATLQPGCYYLVLERGPDKKARLLFLDPKELRAVRMRPSQIAKTKGGIGADLTWKNREDNARKFPTPPGAFDVELHAVSGNPKAVRVVMVFGKMEMATELRAVLPATDSRLGTANYRRRSTTARFSIPLPEGKDPRGRFEVTYGSPAWNPKFEKAIGAKPGTRLRLGDNFFATFDTSCPLEFAGTRIGPGLYYLALELGAANTMSLVFLDPAPIRAAKWDASKSRETRGGTVVPMRWRRVETIAPKLSMKLEPVKPTGTQVTLTIRFGPHELTAGLDAITH